METPKSTSRGDGTGGGGGGRLAAVARRRLRVSFIAWGLMYGPLMLVVGELTVWGDSAVRDWIERRVPLAGEVSPAALFASWFYGAVGACLVAAYFMLPFRRGRGVVRCPNCSFPLQGLAVTVDVGRDGCSRAEAVCPECGEEVRFGVTVRGGEGQAIANSGSKERRTGDGASD